LSYYGMHHRMQSASLDQSIHTFPSKPERKGRGKDGIFFLGKY
jgi:hypothetical protein